jgi:hypothetical protein
MAATAVTRDRARRRRARFGDLDLEGFERLATKWWTGSPSTWRWRTTPCSPAQTRLHRSSCRPDPRRNLNPSAHLDDFESLIVPSHEPSGVHGLLPAAAQWPAYSGAPDGRSSVNAMLWRTPPPPSWKTRRWAGCDRCSGCRRSSPA